MTVIMTSRQFNQGSSTVLRVAESEPVYVTKRGKISHVVMSYEQFQQLSPQQKKNAWEFFNGAEDVADIPDEVFEIKRDIESWGIEEGLFD